MKGVLEGTDGVEVRKCTERGRSLLTHHILRSRLICLFLIGGADKEELPAHVLKFLCIHEGTFSQADCLADRPVTGPRCRQ
jgi:hypothetical protein